MTGQLHPGSHVDADSLSAFLEGALPERERQQCLAHFAECAECREAVFLARQPAETVAPQPTRAIARIPVWRRWLAPIPALSGAVVLCALAVAIFLLFLRNPAPRQPATTGVPQTNSAPSTAAAHPPAQTPMPPRVHSSSRPEPTQASGSKAEAKQPRFDKGAPLGVDVARAEGLSGVVTDVSSAIVPDAKVVLKDEATQTIRETVSNGRGFFKFDNVPPGYYTLTVSGSGFTTWEERGIPIAAQRAWLTVPNIVLQVGGTKSEVAVVAANDVVVRADTGQTSTTLNSHTITQLSLAGRDAAELTKIMPGMSAPGEFTLNRLMLKLDPSGALLISHDSGKDWETVTPTWPGKAVRLAVMVTPEPAVSRPVFLLTTDGGAVWFSPDGFHWNAAPAHR